MDIVEFVEQVLGIDLMEYQKIFLRNAAKQQSLYYIPARGSQLCDTCFWPLWLGIMKLEGENDNESDNNDKN